MSPLPPHVCVSVIFSFPFFSSSCSLERLAGETWLVSWGLGIQVGKVALGFSPGMAWPGKREAGVSVLLPKVLKQALSSCVPPTEVGWAFGSALGRLVAQAWHSVRVQSSAGCVSVAGVSQCRTLGTGWAPDLEFGGHRAGRLVMERQRLSPGKQEDSRAETQSDRIQG